MARFNHIISAIDSHTEGQATRVVLSGFPAIPGQTMAERFVKIKKSPAHNRLREALMREPRGHRGMFGAIVTSPCHPEADLGVIYASGDEFYAMCIHGSMGTAAVMLETGLVKAKEPETEIVFDTAVGLVRARVTVEGGRARAVRIENTPAFLYLSDVAIDVPEVGRVTVDIAFGGLFFALVSGEQLGVKVESNNIDTLVRVSLLVFEAVNKAVEVQHPVEKHMRGIDAVEVTGPPSQGAAHARNIVVIPGGLFDRSPCGTGTCARMAALYAKGKLKLGEVFVNESVIGSLFYGSVLRETFIGELPAVVPAVSGSAFITGIQQFVIDPDDRLGYGFSV